MGKGTRASTACARCYKRKKKCSRDFPTCSECAQAGVNCIGLDRGTESELPRSIVSFLEDAVAKLELERHRYGPPSISDRQSELFDPGSVEAPRTIASSSDGHDLQALYSLSMFSASTSFPYKAFNPNPRDVHPYYRTFFMGAELPYPLAFTVKRPVHAPRCNNSTELTKLPPGVTEALFSTYTDRILPQYPVYTLEEVASLQSKYVSAATDCTLLTPIEQFTASMILAISVLSTRSKDYRKLASLAESLRRDAYARVGYGANIAQPTITSVQQLLLVAQYGFLLPSSTNLWQVVGDAMKTALGLGLHQEAPHHYGLDQETIQFRRRLFWVLYVLERSVAITSHRPYAVAGDMIGTALPEMSNESIPKEPGHYSCYFISFKDRVRVIRIQSELCSINIGKRVILTPSSAYDRWMQEMERRIHELTQTEHTKGFRIMAWQCLILLHMPCAHNPSPSPESTIKCFNAAVELSSGYWELVQSDFVDYPWHGVHKCYEAGMLILYHLWYSASVIRQHYSTRQIFEAVNNLSGFFIIVARQWPAAQQCGTLFDRFRKGALAAFREEESVDAQSSVEAKQLRDIVHRENADLLYANEETRPAGSTLPIDNFLGFEQLDFSLDLPDTTFLDFFDTSVVPELQPTDALLENAFTSADLPEITQPGLSSGSLTSTAQRTIQIDYDQVAKAVRNLPVCSPCKKRRIKCDMLLPSCRNCTKLHKDCKYWDNALLQEVPRKHIHALHEQIIGLTRDLETIQKPQSISAFSASALSFQPDSSLQRTWPAVASPPNPGSSRDVLCPFRTGTIADTTYFGVTSAFGRLLTIRPALRPNMLPPPSVAPEKQSLADIFLSSLDLQKESDVPKEVAEQLIAIYYNSIETWIPVLGHDLIHETFARIYDGTQHTEDQVTIKIRYRLLLSISLSLMKAQDPRLAVAADTCFRQAIATSASTDLLAYPTTSTLQLLVLMCIYIWINPGSMDIWRMLGHTSRMCLDLAEMHGSDKNESAKSEVLYRTLYTLETYICTAYGRPRQLPVPFSPTDQVTQLADDPSRLLYDLARLQNRFHRDLIENGSVLTVAESKMPSSTDFAWMDSCILDIYSWLETWRACIANQGLTATTTEAIDEPPLLVWGQFQQLKTLLLAKAASDRRGKVLITRQEEYSLCRRLVKAAEALHQQSIGPIQGTLSPGHQPTSIFPLTWTWAHSVFTAGVILIQPSISQVTPEPADQALIQICLGLLNSYEMRSEKSGQGLTHCLQSLQDFHRSVVC